MTVKASSQPVKHDEHTFADLLEGRGDQFPVLARAVANSVRASNVFVEWIDPDGTQRRNEQQIVRYPYNAFAGAAEGASAHPQDDRKEDQLELFLAAVEQVLIDGTPTEGRASLRVPIRTCGGYKHFLGRELEDGDVLSLRPLRDPMWRLYTHTGWDREDGPIKLDHPIGEWLCEVSLEVIPQGAK